MEKKGTGVLRVGRRPICMGQLSEGLLEETSYWRVRGENERPEMRVGSANVCPGMGGHCLAGSKESPEMVPMKL